MTEVDLRLLTKFEREEYERFKTITPRDLSPREQWAAQAGNLALFALWTMAFIGITAAALSNTGGDLVVVIYLTLLIAGIALAIRAVATDSGTAKAKANDYLQEIGFFDRSPAADSRQDDRDRSDRTYPVTDGTYDPDLYRSRGGYESLSGMTELGIDDYDTYKNNVLEAD